MIASGLHRRLQAAAALLAVALLAFAVVKSTVMQAEAATSSGSTPICDLHRSGAGHDSGRTPSVCAFCAAAAHSPIQGFAAPVRRPIWLRWTPCPSPLPIAAAPPVPPTPRARGPPRPSDLAV